jgi:transcription elongation factor Elf1
MKEEKKNKEVVFETCKICGLSIEVKVEHHLILQEKIGDIQTAISYYHANCFRDKFLVQDKMQKLISKQMEKLTEILK